MMTIEMRAHWFGNGGHSIELGDEAIVELANREQEPELACSRCGRCCLCSPCWELSPGTEVMVGFDGAPLHICPHFSLHKGVATCAIYNERLQTGSCGNHLRDEFPWSIERVERFLTERRVTR